MTDHYHGYIGLAAELLRSKGITPGSRVRVKLSDGMEVTGVLMPRYEAERRPIIVVKLPNGYNIGIRADRVREIEGLGLLEKGAPGAPVPLLEEEPQPPEAKVAILGTGGTIASRVDYETGAVKPSLSQEELVLAVPEILEYAMIDAEEIYAVLSEDMKPGMWARLVEEVARRIESGYDGVVIAHGTDTMGYTAAALSFAFHRGLPVPVALVGAQRSSDRPSSDAAFNLLSAVIVASRAPFAEVTVVMHGETGDTYALAHRGTRVRKMHTSRRDAFQSINALPLAKVWPSDGRIEVLDPNHRRRGEQELVVDNGFDDKVALIKHFPGDIATVIDALVDKGYHGIVIEGTGFGHIASDAIPSIERAVEEEVPVVIASQTIFGRVNLYVYSNGRRMLQAGVIPVEDMLAETAYVKLSWVLHRTRDMDEVRRLMTTSLAGEISGRHHLRLYPRWYHERL
ncbi:MAG: Glu-tRNA(Gln) amidotransferase subunit GatD [Desulfurococcales archaeon]|nr:Glu-tRNA(Gln) amidotransferase subunit GatD [Desulfurococcales archaeon]